MAAAGLSPSSPAAPAIEPALRFASLSELQEHHAELVKQVGSELLADGHPTRIAEFIRRSVATGSILDAKEDRLAAQSLINFWSSRLTSAVRDAQRAEAAREACALPKTRDCELEDTLLEEFDPSTIVTATAEADRWLGTLADDDRAIVRRIMLRLVRLVGDGQTFEPVPATRAALRELDPSPEKVDALLRRLIEFGIVRATPGNSTETDLLSLRTDALPHEWDTFRSWQQERLAFRRRVIAWDQFGRPTEQLFSGDALEEARDYNDRNPIERLFVELSRREEILRSKRDQERKKLAFLAAIVALLGMLIVGVMAYKWYQSATLATANESVAEAQMEQATLAEQWALFQRSLAERRGEILQQKQQLSEILALVRTLAVIGGGSVAEREIAFQRVDAFRKRAADSPKIKWFFDEAGAQLDAIRSHPGKEKEFKEIQILALNLARSLRDDLLKASTAEVIPRDQSSRVPLDESKVVPGDVIKVLTDERAVIFQTVGFCASRIDEIARKPGIAYHRADPFLREFWVLYWGEMGLVEDRPVETAMVDFGDTLRAIDQRVLEKIRASKGSMETLKDTISLKGLTNRQAIQNIYDAARSVARSELSLDAITKVRLDPKDDADLLASLAANLEKLKQALAQESALPFNPDRKSERISY